MTKTDQSQSPRWRRFGFANVVALLALFVALGGGAYAAATVGTSDIKKKAVTTSKIDKKAVTGNRIDKEAVKKGKIKDEAVTESKVGPGAITNEKLGHPIYLAYVKGGLTPSLDRTVGAVGVSRQNAGNYRVDFGRDLSGCYFAATPTYIGAPRHISAALDVTNSQQVAVRLWNQANNSVDANTDFYLAAHC